MQRSTFLLLGLSLLPGGLAAQILGARPVAATATTKPAIVETRAPAAGSLTGFGSTPAGFSRRITVWDQIQLTKVVITFGRSGTLEVNLDRLEGWQHAEAPQFATAWANRFALQTRFGINDVSGQAAHSLMAGTAWGSTPSSLRRDAKDTCRVLINDDSATNSTMIRPLGWRTRVYECEIVSALADTPLQRQILVAVGDDNQAYLFTFEGPATQVAALERAFTTLVISFEAAPR